MFMYRSTLSRSKREDGMDERYRRTTHDVWLLGFHHGTYPRCLKGVVFTIGWIYFSLLLLPRCLITKFSPWHIFIFFYFFFSFLNFLEEDKLLDNAPWKDKPWYAKDSKWYAQNANRERNMEEKKWKIRIYAKRVRLEDRKNRKMRKKDRRWKDSEWKGC